MQAIASDELPLVRRGLGLDVTERGPDPDPVHVVVTDEDVALRLQLQLLVDEGVSK